MRQTVCHYFISEGCIQGDIKLGKKEGVAGCNYAMNCVITLLL